MNSSNFTTFSPSSAPTILNTSSIIEINTRSRHGLETDIIIVITISVFLFVASVLYFIYNVCNFERARLFFFDVIEIDDEL